VSKAVRIRDHLYAEIEALAKKERRSLISQLEVLLEQALAMESAERGFLRVQGETPHTKRRLSERESGVAKVAEGPLTQEAKSQEQMATGSPRSESRTPIVKVKAVDTKTGEDVSDQYVTDHFRPDPKPPGKKR
jgi:hypothetical protein